MVPTFLIQISISVCLTLLQIIVKNTWIKRTKNHANNMKNAQQLIQEIAALENSLVASKDRITYSQNKLDEIGNIYTGSNMKISAIMFVVNRILSSMISKYTPAPQMLYSPVPIPTILRPIIQRGIKPKDCTEYTISPTFYGLLISQSINGLISRQLLIQTPRAGFGSMGKLAKSWGYSSEQIKSYERLFQQYMGF